MRVYLAGLLVLFLLPALGMANERPRADPKATPSTGTAPLTVQFAANATDPDGNPLIYAWDFGDPSSQINASSDPNPIHTFVEPSSYVVTLTVSDGAGWTVEKLVIEGGSP